ncbi:hypothetical protein GCM10027022_08910 [Alpinimonas psychrophila]|uniref:Uncharacterized protein n=1 Tax=Alpinimonas psychrophila TaxID=748908 RepID=A0A7W3JTB4_9MICO|nr:hypothetical protein [Alpinimonas psychrophila]MBA8828712.1 hypothetical protein [Alpinimonas psychrophila]
MKLFRYRKPSMRRMLGVTKIKRQVKRELGISQVQGWTQPSRLKQRAKQSVGLYSPEVRAVRQTSKGRFPTLFGLFGKK